MSIKPSEFMSKKYGSTPAFIFETMIQDSSVTSTSSLINVSSSDQGHLKSKDRRFIGVVGVSLRFLEIRFVVGGSTMTCSAADFGGK